MLGLGLIVYFIPSMVASARDHPNTTAILVLNCFLGWTFVGWVVALVWASVAIRHRKAPTRVHHEPRRSGLRFPSINDPEPESLNETDTGGRQLLNQIKVMHDRLQD